MTSGARVLVVGGGISGLATAVELLDDGRFEVEVREATDRIGGKIKTSPFAGVEYVDEGGDAYLTRVPHAVRFADHLGLTSDDLTSPTGARALVWHDGMHDIPEGIVLGMPAAITPFVTTSLLSWRGKLRASLEPFLPRTDADDSLGRLVRARFGDEVHERLVDSLVGSIYATDTDQSSLESVPQLAVLAREHRSLLLGARAARKRATSPSPDSPIFAAPRRGMYDLVESAISHIAERGGRIVTGAPVASIEPDGDCWRIDDEVFDHVVLATPGKATAHLLGTAAPEAAALLDEYEHCDVIMVRLAVPGDDWPERLHGRSGYLVPKPVQGLVTAVSFASQKWAHWSPADSSQILRVSLGRDGLPVAHLDDDAAITTVVDEMSVHLGFDIQPSEVSVGRWIGAFPQYRPHHFDRVRAIEAALPPGIEVTGASYRGIGIPACIGDGRRAAERIKESISAADGFLS